MTDRQFPFTDEEILRWEQQRGTLPPPQFLGTEWDCERPPATNGKASRATYREAQAAMKAARGTP